MPVRYGKFGGCFVSELLYPFLQELAEDYASVKQDEQFSAQLQSLQADYFGRPTPLYFARGFSAYLKGAKIYLKREDLNHTGSALALPVLGHALLAKTLGRRELLTAAVSGVQALAAAAAAARFNLALSVHTVALPPWICARLQKIGAQIITHADYALPDLSLVCLREWSAEPVERYYIPALPVGPHPLPEITRDFQSRLGLEIQTQTRAKENRVPDYLLADAATAPGAFYPFIQEDTILTVAEPVCTAADLAPLSAGQPGVFQGAYTRVLQHKNGRPRPYFSPCLTAYPAAPPELAYWHSTERLSVQKTARAEMLSAQELLLRTEGIAVSLDSAAVLAELARLAPALGRDKILVGVLHGTDLEA